MERGIADLRVQRIAVALAFATPALAQGPSATRLAPARRATPVPKYVSVELPDPCPVDRGRFGESVALLDFDADGRMDVAVGASGTSAVYVLYGTGDPEDEPPYSGFEIFDADGAASCPPGDLGDAFGSALAAGELDGDPGAELVVGAPAFGVSTFVLPPGPSYPFGNLGAAYVIGLQSSATPVRLVSDIFEASATGASLAVGDFDGDGDDDVAVGAPRASVAGNFAGRVHIFYGPIVGPGPLTPDLTLENPDPARNGNFGHDLAVDDHDGDGRDDLFVSAVGNTSQGVLRAGQIYYYPGPVARGSFAVIEDPTIDPNDVPTSRFGMSIDARGGRLAVGSPRKDLNGVANTGGCVLFLNEEFTQYALLTHPHPLPEDLLGFRVVLAQLLGDATPDTLVAGLPGQSMPDPNPLAAYLWDGAAPHGPEVELLVAPRSADHYPQGARAGQLFPTVGADEIVFGDPSFDVVAVGSDVGRVVVYYAR